MQQPGCHSPSGDTLVVVGQVLGVRRDVVPTARQQVADAQAAVPGMGDLVQHPLVDAPRHPLLDVGGHHERIKLR